MCLVPPVAALVPFRATQEGWWLAVAGRAGQCVCVMYGARPSWITVAGSHQRGSLTMSQAS